MMLAGMVPESKKSFDVAHLKAKGAFSLGHITTRSSSQKVSAELGAFRIILGIQFLTMKDPAIPCSEVIIPS